MSSPSKNASRKPQPILSNRDIVIVALDSWDGPKRIRHYITDELLRRKCRVLFVESYYTLSKFVKAPSMDRIMKFRKGPVEIREGLYVLSSFPFIPLGEFSQTISFLNWQLQREFIRRALKRLGFRDIMLWVFAYNAGSLVGALSEELALYFCNDAFAHLVQPRRLQKTVESLERRLIEKVDVVLTVSDKLSEEKSKLHPHVYTIYHGVDFTSFEKALAKARPPTDIPAKKPLIGYSGVIREMIDLNLVDYLSMQKPGWTFVFVGPVAESSKRFYDRVDELSRRANIVFTGARPIQELPKYINSFDVCLLPYVQNTVSTYYSAPLKFFEYLAAGKPVVSTVGPRNFGKDVVINASSHREVLEGIQKALRMNQRRQIELRKKIAAQNSWGARVDRIEEILCKYL